MMKSVIKDLEKKEDFNDSLIQVHLNGFHRIIKHMYLNIYIYEMYYSFMLKYIITFLFLV